MPWLKGMCKLVVWFDDGRREEPPGTPLRSIFTVVPRYQIRSVSGLVVKSIVAIDGPRVRFAADASELSLLPFSRLLPLFFFNPVFAEPWKCCGCQENSINRRFVGTRYHQCLYSVLSSITHPPETPNSVKYITNQATK